MPPHHFQIKIHYTDLTLLENSTKAYQCCKKLTLRPSALRSDGFGLSQSDLMAPIKSMNTDFLCREEVNTRVQQQSVLKLTVLFGPIVNTQMAPLSS